MREYYILFYLADYTDLILRPIEVTSKRPVTRRRQIVETKKIVSKPRVLSGLQLIRNRNLEIHDFCLSQGNSRRTNFRQITAFLRTFIVVN